MRPASVSREQAGRKKKHSSKGSPKGAHLTHFERRFIKHYRQRFLKETVKTNETVRTLGNGARYVSKVSGSTASFHSTSTNSGRASPYSSTSRTWAEGHEHVSENYEKPPGWHVRRAGWWHDHPGGRNDRNHLHHQEHTHTYFFIFLYKTKGFGQVCKSACERSEWVRLVHAWVSCKRTARWRS